VEIYDAVQLRKNERDVSDRIFRVTEFI
jgi:hypothetical protein